MKRAFFKIIKSVVGILLVLFITFLSFFFDIRTSRGCAEHRMCFSLIDLKLKDQDEEWKDNIIDSWTSINMLPGKEYPLEESFIKLKQAGFAYCDHIEIGLGYSIRYFPGAEQTVSADDMAEMMLFTRLEYGNTDWKINLLTGKATGNPPYPFGYRPGDWRVEDTDGDGKITFRDLKDDPLDDLPPPQFWMDERKCPTMRMSVRFADEADNRFMGVALNVSFVYTLNQCSRQ